MGEWREVAIEEICTVQRGGSPRPIHDFLAPQGTPWIKISDATSGNDRFIDSTEEFIRSEGESKSRVVEPGAFILSNSATPGLPRFVRIRACIHDGWLLLSDFRDVDEWFLHYKLKDERELILLKGNGSIFTNLKTTILKEHRITLPPLPEQRAIASVLSSLDAKIDLLHRQNKTLEAMAEALFRQWFVEDAEEGWEEVLLGDLVEVRYGKDHKALGEGNIPVYGSGGVMRYADRALFEGESVLIPRKGSLNNVMYVNEAFWTVDTMFFTEMKRPNLAKFIYHFVKSHDLASMNVGSAVPSMTTAVLNNMPLEIPGPEVFAKYEATVGPLYAKHATNTKQIQSLTALRDTLLPKLMSGEVRVKMQVLSTR